MQSLNWDTASIFNGCDAVAPAHTQTDQHILTSKQLNGLIDGESLFIHRCSQNNKPDVLKTSAALCASCDLSNAAAADNNWRYHSDTGSLQDNC